MGACNFNDHQGGEIMHKMAIQPGCVRCGKCSYILPGWPERYMDNGLLISEHHLEENGEAIDKVVESCPLDLIEINVVPTR